MKMVMTLLVRDECDILDAHLRYHLERGVDFVIATDHRAGDGTTEILRGYERDGHLHLIRESGDAVQQAHWVTRMARLAANDFGADWVINAGLRAASSRDVWRASVGASQQSGRNGGLREPSFLTMKASKC